MINSASKKYHNSGKILSLMNVDTYSVYMMFLFMNILTTSPTLVFLGITLICNEIGLLGLLSPAIFIAGFILQMVVHKKSIKIRTKMSKFTDERAKTLVELIKGFKIIKYYGWENVMNEKIKISRNMETVQIYKRQILRGFLEALNLFFPNLLILITFTVLFMKNDNITLGRTFEILVFNYFI